MHPVPRHVLAGLTALVLLAAPVASEAQLVVIDEPSDDTSPYSYIPLLLRGDYHTMYTYELGIWEDGYTHDQRTFIRFDLPPGLLDPGETVVQASLIMVYAFSFSHWPDTDPPPEVDITLEAREVLQPWNEDTLTWANQPTAGDPVDIVADHPYDTYGPIELDVTHVVASWAHGTRPNYGFLVTNPASRPAGFWTKEAFEDFANAGNPLDPDLRSILVIVKGPLDPNTVPALTPVGTAASALLLALSGAWMHRRRLDRA